MEQSPHEQIESIVRSLEQKGVRAAPVVEAVSLASSHPEAVSDLAIAVMRRFPKGGTFLDAALSYLPQEDWPALVQHALDALGESPDKKSEAAGAVIAYASLQSPSALHAHLSRIFVVRPNEGCYYEKFAWRESGDLHFDYLRAVIESPASTDDARTRAWADMCETRHPDVIEYAISCGDLPGVAPSGWSQEEWVIASLWLVFTAKAGPFDAPAMMLSTIFSFPTRTLSRSPALLGVQEFIPPGSSPRHRNLFHSEESAETDAHCAGRTCTDYLSLLRFRPGSASQG